MGGVLLIAFGIGTALFGGNKITGTTWTVFGFEFGEQRSEPMGRLESVFWGAVAVVAGIVLIKYYG